MENNNETQPATGCLKWAAAGIVLVVLLLILGNLPLIFNCAVILIFGGIGLAIIIGILYLIVKGIQAVIGEQHANRNV